jgi:Zn-dependent protease
MQPNGSISGPSRGMSRVGYVILFWILYFAVVAFATVLFMGLLGDTSVVRNLLLVSLIFVCILPVYFLAEKLLVQKVGQTEEQFVIGRDVVPWSRISQIALKRSEMENTYLVLYFRDGTLPKSYDTVFFDSQENSIGALRDRAQEKGFIFTVEEGIVIDEVIPPRVPFPTSTPLLHEMKVEYERQKKIREESQEREPEKKSGEPQIRISHRMKSLVMIGLAGSFFLGIWFVFDILTALALFLVVLVHEMGHFIALKACHLKVHGIFFVPFLGAGVAPEEPFPSPEVEAVVALAGPVMGLSWNLGAHWLGSPMTLKVLFGGEPLALAISLTFFLTMAVYINLALNLLNLAPILPLDGGRIVRVALLRGRKSLIPVSIITVGIGAAAVVLLKDVILLIVVVLGGASLIYDYGRIKKKEVSPPAKWKCVVILGAWISVILLSWYTLPGPFRTYILSKLASEPSW